MLAAFERQTMCLVLALILAMAWPELSFAAFVVCYVLSTLISGVLMQKAWLGSATPKQRGLILLLLGLPAATHFAQRAPELIAHEALGGIVDRTRSKLALEAMPSLAPSLISLDRPQTFFIHARPNADVEAQFAPGVRTLKAEALGHGVYRVEYDPRRDGTPSTGLRGARAILRVDGENHPRDITFVKPLAHPRFLCVSPDRTLAATVSEETDELIWLSSDGLVRRQPTADGPTDCAFTAAREVVVSHRYTDELWQLTPESDAPQRRLKLARGQHRLATSQDRTRLAVARQGATPEVLLVDTSRFEALARVPLDVAPDWLGFGAGADTLIVSTRQRPSLRKLRESHGHLEQVAQLALSRPVVSMHRSADPRELLLTVTDYQADGKARAGNHFVQDQLLTLDIETFSVTASLVTARRSARQEKPGDVDRGLSPMGMDATQDGSRWLTFAGSSELWRWSAGRAEPEVVDLETWGLIAPHGVAVLKDGSVIVSSPARGLLGIFEPQLQRPRLVALAASDETLERQDPDALARRLGEWGFYEGTRSGISCQSCHLHADSDEALHNLGGRRLLPTLSVRGLFGTAPFLRDGSYMHIGDLDHVTTTLYRGYRRKTQGRAYTLDAFVNALVRPESRALTEPRDIAKEKRGVTAFYKAGCPLCHAAPLFSGLGQHPARSLFTELTGDADESLDAPSLLSTASRPPYLHDGRAESLDAVLVRHNRDNRHGNTRALSESERAALVHFLESL